MDPNKGYTLSHSVEELFQSQLKEWGVAGKNYAGLEAVICKEIHLNGFDMQMQFNPERIRSSAAKVDTRSIQERPCFLCPSNLSEEQKGIDYLLHYNILINPFPIFKKHLTIPDQRHTDQRINGRIGDMLHLAQDLPEYVIFYNGPKCGASAPDHFHFQAGSKGMMPIEKDIRLFQGKKLLKETPEGSSFIMEHYSRKTLMLQSSHSEWIIKEFEALFAHFGKLQPNEDEPLMNILSFYENNSWQLIVFPRRQHRPSQFFEEGEKQILFSPGAVDFGGTLIFPRTEDFEKVNAELIEDMFSQLTLSDEMWKQLLTYNS